MWLFWFAMKLLEWYVCGDVGVRTVQCLQEECYGPMNAQCVTIQSCKGFVYLYMIMGKINHWSKWSSLVLTTQACVVFSCDPDPFLLTFWQQKQHFLKQEHPKSLMSSPCIVPVVSSISAAKLCASCLPSVKRVCSIRCKPHAWCSTEWQMFMRYT